MWRKLYILFISFLTVSTLAIAQGDIKAVKVGVLTDRMNLTPQQSEKFWPIYNRYEDEIRALRRAKQDAGRSDNAQAKVDELQRLDELRLQIRAKYKNEFLRVISVEQLAALYDAENEFKQMLLKRLDK